MSFGQYVRFLTVGGFVAVLTIGCRELIGYLLVADGPLQYSVSVVLAYSVGIVMSFLLNRRLTFKSDSDEFAGRKFLLFVGVALAGMACTWLLSFGLRYGLRLDAFAGSAAGAIAFGAAALLSSMITYPLNAALVFRTRS